MTTTLTILAVVLYLMVGYQAMELLGLKFGVPCPTVLKPLVIIFWPVFLFNETVYDFYGSARGRKK
jgi:hypothetical protein